MSLAEPLLQLARISIEWLRIFSKVSNLCLFRILMFYNTMWLLESPFSSYSLCIYSLVHVLSISNLVFCHMDFCNFCLLFYGTLSDICIYFISPEFWSVPLQLMKSSEFSLEITSPLCTPESNSDQKCGLILFSRGWQSCAVFQ